MLNFLIALSVVILINGGSKAGADPVFFQQQSNIESIQEQLNLPINPLPLITATDTPNLNFLVQPMDPTAQAAKPPVDSSIRVNLFPVLNYKTKEFAYVMGDPYYLATPNLGAVRLTAAAGALHLRSLRDGKIIGNGSKLSFNLSKQTFILDGKVSNFKGLLLSQGPDEVTHVEWQTTKGIRGYDYYGNFIITREITPEKAPAIRVINVVDLETKYIPCVTPNEMAPDGHPFAALEAQATASRTYAYNSREVRRSQGLDFDVFASIQDQLYVCKPKLENDRVNQAVANTAGKVIYYNDHIIQAMFSSNCGGQSVGYQDYSTQHTRIPYLTSVKELNPKVLRQLKGGTTLYAFNSKTLASTIRALGIRFNDPEVLAVTPAALNSSGRATSLQIRGANSTIVISGNQFNNLKTKLGLRSYIGSATAVNGSISIPCYGDGHNVGFCQVGGILAADLAEKAGKDSPDLYAKILTHYYKGTTVGDYIQR